MFLTSECEFLISILTAPKRYRDSLRKRCKSTRPTTIFFFFKEQNNDHPALVHKKKRCWPPFSNDGCEHPAVSSLKFFATAYYLYRLYDGFSCSGMTLVQDRTQDPIPGIPRILSGRSYRKTFFSRFPFFFFFPRKTGKKKGIISKPWKF